MMTKREALNQHVRFDERNDASAATSRRGGLFYIKRLIFVVGIFCYVNALHAEIWYLTESGNYSFRDKNVSLWMNAKGENAEVFNRDDTYVVRNDMSVKVITGKCSTSMGTVQLGLDENNSEEAKIIQESEFYLPKIIVYRGAIEQNTGDNAINTLSSDIEICNSTGLFFWRWMKGNQTILMNGKITGVPESNIRTDVRYANGGHMNETLELAGDCSEFFGTIKVQRRRDSGDYTASYPNFWAKLRLSTANFNSPMSIMVEEGSALETSSAIVNNVTLDNNTTVAINVIPNGSGLVVTNSFVLEGNVFLEISADGQEWAEVDRPVTNYCSLITVPLSQNVDWSKFTLKTKMPFEWPEQLYYSVTNAVVGTETFTLAVPPVVKLVVSDAKSKEAEYPTSAFTNAASWSGAMWPHTDIHYVVECLDGISTYIRTPYTKEWTQYEKEIDIKSLTLGMSCYLVTWCKKLKMPALRMLDGSYLWTGGGASGAYRTIDAVLEIPSGTAHVGAYNKCTIIFDGPIKGHGTMLIEGVTTSTGSRRGNVSINADNNEFFGRIHVKQYLKNNVNQTQTLLISKASNLGADLQELDYRALTIDYLGHLLLTNSIALEASGKRGVWLCNGGTVNITNADDVLTLNWPLTIEGSAKKAGCGTLALGGDVFTEGSGVFEIENGSIQPLASDLCSNANLTFAFHFGGRLLIDLETDLGEFGFINTAGVPFVLKEGVLALPISVQGEKEAALSDNGKHALVTVSAEVADEVAAMLPELPPKPIPALAASWTRTENADKNTVTFGVEYKYVGSRIIVR